MKLSNEHRVQLDAALNSAFEDKDALSNMLSLRLGKKYDDFAGENLPTKIVKIISKAETQGWIFDLVEASRAQNPTNIDLEEIQKVIKENYKVEIPVGDIKSADYLPTETEKLFNDIDCILFHRKKDTPDIFSLKFPEKKKSAINFSEDNKIETNKVFKGVAPYYVEDCHYLVGRKDESDFLTREILENGQNPIITGEPFIGKTSFINAGLIASILEKNVSFSIVRFEKYDNFLQKIDTIIEFFDNDTESRKLLILDQFEVFLYSLNDYDLIDAAKKFSETFSKNIQIILSSRDDESRHKIASINDRCNSKFKFYGLSAAERLKCFSQNDCNKILESLNKKTDDDFEADNFQKLTTECFQLEENISEISPLIFQIVCFGLQKTLILTPLRERNDDFYNKNNALFLLEDYVRSVLNGNLADIGADSSEILSLINTQVNQNYLSTDEIIESFKDTQKNSSLDRTKLEQILDRLEKEKLVFKRKEKNLYKYSLTILSYDRIAENLKADTVFKELLTANQILHSKWHLSELAASNDLELFKKFRDDLDLNSSKLFFLIRSSFEENKPLYFWYAKLLTDGRGKKFLEKMSGSYKSDNFFKLFWDKNNNGVPEENGSYGLEDFLKNKAAASQKLPVRQTAIVALTILQGEAFQLTSSNLFKRAEIVGTILDYLPNQGNKFKFNIIDRFISWIWRIVRRIQLSTFSFYDFIIALAFIFAGGLIYALSRGNFYNLLSFWRILSIAATSLILMPLIEIFILVFMFGAKFTQIKSLNDEHKEDKNRSNFSDILVILAGAIIFGFINFVCNFFSKDFPGIGEKGLAITVLWCFLGIIAGAGIGLGLKIQKVFGKESGLIGFLIGGVIAISLFSFVQFLYGSLFPELSLILSNSVFEALFAGFSFYLGLSYATIKGKLFNGMPDKITY